MKKHETRFVEKAGFETRTVRTKSGAMNTALQVASGEEGRSAPSGLIPGPSRSPARHGGAGPNRPNPAALASATPQPVRYRAGFLLEAADP